MAPSKRPQPPKKPVPADPREARLAKALRDNLRRRKAPPPPADPATEPSGD